MRYNVSNDFTKISETDGTIQNISNVYTVEISDKAVPDSGILLFPLNQFSFKSPTIYMRCTDAGGWAECRVVNFITSTSTDSTTDEDTAVNQMFDDILNASGSDYPTDKDTDDVIDSMWTSDNPDTDDGFSAALDDIFGF